MMCSELNNDWVDAATQLACQRNRLLSALEHITTQAESWHRFHADTMVQCDAICDALPICREAIDSCKDSEILERIQAEEREQEDANTRTQPASTMAISV